tara:strand:+ start:1373 stop:2653 length:1281 start_codon:yes stop_codon:yes gene_type:complete
MSSILKVDTIQDQAGNNIINENANTITIGASGDTITIPAGATISNLGTSTGFSSISWQSSIVTAATHTASAGQGIWINTTSNACNLTLPGSPSVGDELIFSDFARKWGTNAVTLTLNGSKFQGFTSPDPVYSTSGETVHIVYSGSTQGWIPINDGAVSNEVPQTTDIDFLVVAGGGAAGRGNTGGGGAGGFRTATETGLVAGITITVNVGNGGVYGNPKGTAGSVSNFSGTGLTTIESAGGGFSGSGSHVGGSGGSGGGAGYDGSAGSGNTPSTTPSQGNNGGAGQLPSPYRGGGGGGASQAGQTGPAGGNGGNGTQSSITGSATYYAGGGGAAVEHSASASSGGQGGGGNGNNSTGEAVAGGVNTGGGGGGAYLPYLGKAGGSGVVILSMPDANYTGTVTGSPTVTTGVSGKTIIKFTGNGTYVT